MHKKDQDNFPSKKQLIPPNDAERVRVLRMYQILDTPPEDAFDNLAQIIADDFDAPIALISLVDKDHVFFKANVGMPGVTHTDREISLCSLAILSEEPVIFPNALEEPCLLANPLVHGKFGLRFYAGAPLITPDGFPIGSVCIVDKTERSFSQREEKRLKRYADIIMHEIELRLAVRQKTEALERETAIRQKMVTDAVIKAQENERSLIGRELHDNVNQVLTTVKLYNEMVMSNLGNSKNILEKSTGYIQECIDEIRSISKRLSAPTIGGICLEDSIKELVTSLNRTNKIKLEYKTTGMKGCKVNQDLHLSIYRIVQEQLNNIIKHSQAGNVVISLCYKEKALHLDMTDDGIGFDPNEVHPGIGILNMKTRAENANGTFQIKSERGKGCKLLISFPEVNSNCG